MKKNLNNFSFVDWSKLFTDLYNLPELRCRGQEVLFAVRMETSNWAKNEWGFIKLVIVSDIFREYCGEMDGNVVRKKIN